MKHTTSPLGLFTAVSHVCVTQAHCQSVAYVVKVLAQSYLAADEFVGQVVVLLLQTHVRLLQPTVLPLETRREREEEEEVGSCVRREVEGRERGSRAGERS